jgi:glycerate 2-kinase
MRDLRADLHTILEEGLRAADPERAVSESLRLEQGALRVCGRRFALKGRVYVLAFGKASVGMARAVERLLKDRIEDGIVIAPHPSERGLSKLRLRVGTHPSPSGANVAATLEALELARGLGRDDILLVLISGGGSSLLCLPVEGIGLEEKARTAELLMRAGADIREINVVRKHLSQVKGGRLSKLAAPARVISLIISDVVGDDPGSIASGPTYPDKSTFSDALRILARYGLLERVPPRVLGHLREGAAGRKEETPKPGDASFRRTHNFIIANNLSALRAMKARARALGYRARIISSALQGEAREVGKAIASILITSRLHGEPLRPPSCFIFGGETTVSVRGGGRGGRNQELALSAALMLQGLDRVFLAALASDGIDGTSDAAGAFVDGSTVERALAGGLDPLDFLEDNNTHRFFLELADQIRTGPTGTNVGDFVVGLVGSEGGGRRG